MLLHATHVKNSGKYGGIGRHTFRQTYRFSLDETGAPMKVQQELMRHASIQTTMNVYGQAMSSSKREANGKVVEMVLKPLKRAPKLHFCYWEFLGVCQYFQAFVTYWFFGCGGRI